jgi:hypothetical protein
MISPRMRTPRHLLLAVALAAVLAFAGCGSSVSSETSAPAPVGGAEVMPKGTAALAVIDTNVEGEQWQAAEALVKRFPAGGELIQKALADLGTEGVDWETDVAPALGPTVSVGVVDTAGGVVIATQPDDPAALDALIEQGDGEAVKTEVDGWAIVAEKQATLDAFEAARADGALADDPRFQEATAELGGDALVTLYLDGTAAFDAAKALGTEGQQGTLRGLDQLLPGTSTLEWMSATVRAEEGGVRLAGLAKATGAQEAKPFASSLVLELPAGALVFATFSNLDASLDQALDAMGEQSKDFDQQLAQIELLLGISVRDDVLPLFAGEGALAVYPGPAIPTVSIILSVEDEAKAAATVDRLVQAISGFAGAFGGGDATTPKVEETDVDGVPAKKIDLGQVSLYYAAFDGKLVLTTGREGISGLRAEGEKLASDPDFVAASDAAGLPSETTGFAYVNVGEVADLVEQLSQLGGDPLPAEAGENLRHLGGAVVWADQDGDRLSFSGFVGIE